MPGSICSCFPKRIYRKNALVVPSKAIQTNDQGPYVFIVDKNNKAVIRNV